MKASTKAEQRRRRAAAERRTFVADFLQRRPRCEVAWDDGCERWSCDVHEPWTRARGGPLNDPTNSVAVCRHCHDRIHGNPYDAAQRGWLRSGP